MKCFKVIFRFSILTWTKTTSPTWTFGFSDVLTDVENRMSPRLKLGRIDSLLTMVTKCRHEMSITKLTIETIRNRRQISQNFDEQWELVNWNNSKFENIWTPKNISCVLQDIYVSTSIFYRKKLPCYFLFFHFKDLFLFCCPSK
jgi:hypothetical protein